MSLSTALSIAQSSILNTGRQTSVVSRNVLESQNPDYARRSAVVSSSAPGARVVEIHRATNEQLFRQNLSAQSAWSGQGALYYGMEQLGLAVNGVDNATSPANAIGELQKALQLYSASPSNGNLAANAVNAARQVVRGLNDASTSIQTFRVQTDQEIATAVNELNTLLADFEAANNSVINGTRAGRNTSDALDQRDAILKKIADYVPVSSFKRGDNDMVLMTMDGTTLFEAVPRTVSFQPSTAYAAGMTGNAVYVDGVPIATATGGNTNASGKIAGLVQLRDSVSSTMQSQLDEIARGLITAFAETDQTGGAAPDAPGLFTWTGAPGMPPAGTLVDGLAATIRLNAAMDPSVGGNPQLLRDGGANGAAYVANTTGGASYAELLIAYGDRLEQPMAFDNAAGNGANSSLVNYSTSAIGWFEGLRQEAFRAAESKEALAVRTAEALSNETGVNVDMEMSLLLDLEHSYEASARLIKAVDDMLASLLAAVR
ncbi:flagellar hook-associated protein FlgK [Allomesorhizobium camelthorni]|uniref:Flagellar hook-associated protein 1 n=1 Tax=Allomesorhizobium camelthorni TaxID=475069 RepID=A0A6G4WA97_9HYPH|nr:flagellar hook-associated protein FlgK [Mesorhizobium camelthorni]NGO51702.1 flagellar hook-associated protein FlgK [Mesorhizobium camelthorni]